MEYSGAFGMGAIFFTRCDLLCSRRLCVSISHCAPPLGAAAYPNRDVVRRRFLYRTAAARAAPAPHAVQAAGKAGRKNRPPVGNGRYDQRYDAARLRPIVPDPGRNGPDLRPILMPCPKNPAPASFMPGIWGSTVLRRLFRSDVRSRRRQSPDLKRSMYIPASGTPPFFSSSRKKTV